MMFKLRLTLPLLKLAAFFIDYEAESLPPDGRIVEYGYVAGKLAKFTPSKILDVGCTARFNYIPATLCFSGWEVDGIDTRKWLFSHPNFRLIIGDARCIVMPDETYDCVYAISTIEHIGLRGYYGERELDVDGDIKTVREIHRVLKPKGILIITVPCKKNYEGNRGARFYDANRLSRLIEGFTLVDEVFYTQGKDGKWKLIEQCDITDRIAIAMLELQK